MAVFRVFNLDDVLFGVRESRECLESLSADFGGAFLSGRSVCLLDPDRFDGAPAESKTVPGLHP